MASVGASVEVLVDEDSEEEVSEAEDSVVEDLAGLEVAEASVDSVAEEAEDKLYPLVNRFMLHGLLLFIDFFNNKPY